MPSDSVYIMCVLLVCFAEGRKKTLLTYNVALNEFIGFGTLDPGTTIPSRTERRDAIIDKLNKSRADVVCLQEVYFGEDMDAIVDGLKLRYPYSFSALHDASGDLPLDGLSQQPACNLSLLTPFATCFQLAGCLTETTPDGAFQCFNASCGSEFRALPEDCWHCIITSGPDLNDAVQRCTELLGPGPYTKMNGPGLLLLSRRQMRAQEYVDLHPGTREVFQTGYLEAEVRNMGQIVCTHTTHYDGVYFEVELAGFTGYGEKGRFEITALAERFCDKKRLFLLGDVNVGPGFPPDVLSEHPGNFAILADVFNVDPVRSCTFCNSTENSYNGNSKPKVIDHILSKGYRPLRKKRIFDDVTVGGFPLSDHFGVIQSFKRLRFKAPYTRRNK